MKKKTIRDIKIKGQKIFVRVDFNVPMDKELNISDDSRIIAALPTINYLLDNGGRVILCSHMGRPKGKYLKELRLDAVARKLSDVLGREVKKMNTVMGPEVSSAVEEMSDGEIVLLENIRMDIRETENDEEFAKELASLADVYVNDAFGAAHRAHASTAGIAKFIPAVAGLLMEKELNALGTAVTKPEKPFAVIIGGAKVSDKIGVIHNLFDKADSILIGGGMANTFALAQGYEVGKSLIEAEKKELAASLIEAAKDKGVNLLLPIDCVTSKGIDDKSDISVCDIDKVEDDKMILDIGPKTIERYHEVLKKARTIVWNGPMGVFEVDEYSQGTLKVAESVACCDAFSIVGGGDSMAALKKAGLSNKITHISTGGGASLEFLEGKKLPGVEALNDKE